MKYTATKITGIGDPFVLYDNGTYYMYATHDNNGISVWKGSSPKDLEYAGICYRGEDSFGYECFWAPEVVKRADGRFVMHLTARDRRDGILRTGVAVSDSPEGTFKDAVAGSAMFDIGTATIDASCFIDDDGKAYLFFVKDCSTNIINGIHTSQIFAAELSSDLTSLVSELVLIAEPSQEWETHSLPAPTVGLIEDFESRGEKTAFLWNEGPSVLKHNGKYYLTYSANCFDSRFYSVGYAVAQKPLGPYIKCGDNPIMSYIEGELSGPGHNSFFKNERGETLCAFHAHTYYDKPSGDRRYCFCGVSFDKDGRLKLLYK